MVLRRRCGIRAAAALSLHPPAFVFDDGLPVPGDGPERVLASRCHTLLAPVAVDPAVTADVLIDDAFSTFPGCCHRNSGQQSGEALTCGPLSVMPAKAKALRVHLLDQDAMALEELGHILRKAGLEVTVHRDFKIFFSACSPDVPCCLVSEFFLAGMNGFELQALLCARQLALPVIFMSRSPDLGMAVLALQRGAFDFLQKPCDPQRLVTCVQRSLPRADMAARLARLTEREQQVLACIVARESSKQIARRLAISPRTVEHHREHLMNKMAAGSRSELIEMAIVLGLNLKVPDNA